jgi:hypothetical protein
MQHNICGPPTRLKSQLSEKNMPEILRLLKDQFETPIGEMVIAVDNDGNLRAVDRADHTNRMLNLLKRHYDKNGFTLESAHNPGGLTETMKTATDLAGWVGHGLRGPHQAGISPRHLERMSLQYAGMSPRTMTRIARFSKGSAFERIEILNHAYSP